MGSYNIFLRTTAEHDWRNLDKQLIPRIDAALDSLVEDPFPSGHRRIRGKKTKYRFSRVRVGEYRIIYQVDTVTKEIDVWYIRHRDDAYRDI